MFLNQKKIKNGEFLTENGGFFDQKRPKNKDYNLFLPNRFPISDVLVNNIKMTVKYSNE